MYIFKGTKLFVGWFAHSDKSKPATFACSPKGWTDRELGLEYLKKKNLINIHGIFYLYL
jgi:hypothetical protein